MTGASFTHFSPLNLRRQVSGFGESGVVTSELSFSVPKSEYCGSIRAAPVRFILTDSENNWQFVSQPFYVNSRSASSGVINFVCYDRMAFADSITFSCDGFTGNKYDSTSVLEGCAAQLGTEGFINGGGSLFYIDKDYIKGKTVGQILGDISTVWAGVFYITNDNALCFCRMGTPSANTSVTVAKHTALDIGIETEITGLIMVDNEAREYIEGDENGFVVKISSGIANENIAESVGAAVVGKTIASMQCQTAILGNIPEVCSNARFAEDISKEFILHSIDLTISSRGIIGRLQSNEHSSGEIGEYLSRQNRILRRALKIGERYKNFGIDAEGPYMTSGIANTALYSARSANADDTEKYRFDVRKEKIVISDANTYSKETASDITVSENADSVTYMVDGVLNTISLAWNGDIASIRNRIISKNGEIIYSDEEEST